jgi:hypothetical protein
MNFFLPNCSLNKKMCVSAHVNTGTPSGADHIKLTDNLCPHAGQYSFLHTSYYLDYPSTSFAVSFSDSL